MTNQSEIATISLANEPTAEPQPIAPGSLEGPALPTHRRAAKAQRNLAIFKKVEIEKLPHKEVAVRFRLRRARVSQIVNQVRRQLAQAGADDPEIQSHLARQRLEKTLEKLRLEYALQAAATAMRRDQPTLVTNRSGHRQRNGQEEGWSEVITRDKTPNVQAIKTFLRITRELGNRNEREIAANPVGENLDQLELFTTIANILSEWSAKAPSSSDPPSPEFLKMVGQFQLNLRQWIYRFRCGLPASEAWPFQPQKQERNHHTPEPNQHTPEANQPSPEASQPTPEASQPSPEINHHSPEINLALTSSEPFAAVTTATAPVT